MIYLLNGARIHPDLPFVTGGVQYPPEWIRSASPSDLASIGISTIDDQPMPDPEWYSSTANPDGTWNANPRDLGVMRDGLKARVKAVARAKILALCPEWKQVNIVSRGVEVAFGMLINGTAFASLPTETQDEFTAGMALWTAIKAIRVKSGLIEAEIDATIDSLTLSFTEKVSTISGLLLPDNAGWD